LLSFKKSLLSVFGFLFEADWALKGLGCISYNDFIFFRKVFLGASGIKRNWMVGVGLPC
jgi:hypothetical protein